MSIAADIYIEAKEDNIIFDKIYFSGVLSDFISNFDWSNTGPLKGLGGEAGVKEALGLLRKLRSKSKLKVLKNGK